MQENNIVVVQLTDDVWATAPLGISLGLGDTAKPWIHNAANFYRAEQVGGKPPRPPTRAE